MNPPSAQRLEHRLEESARALMLTHPLLSRYTSKERDEDVPLTPEKALPRPLLILHATDTGRYKPYAPIRILKLDITIRANAKTPQGESDPFDAICAGLEQLCDLTNLGVALTIMDRGIAVMLAVRQPGCAHAVVGMIRTQTYSLDVRAVGSEHVA